METQIKVNSSKKYGFIAFAALALAFAVGTPAVSGHADTTGTTAATTGIVGIQPASQMIATGGSDIIVKLLTTSVGTTYEDFTTNQVYEILNNGTVVYLPS